MQFYGDHFLWLEIKVFKLNKIAVFKKIIANRQLLAHTFMQELLTLSYWATCTFIAFHFIDQIILLTSNFFISFLDFCATPIFFDKTLWIVLVRSLCLFLFSLISNVLDILDSLDLFSWFIFNVTYNSKSR